MTSTTQLTNRTDICPGCGSDTYPLLGTCVTCTNENCERYNVGWDPEKESG